MKISSKLTMVLVAIILTISVSTSAQDMPMLRSKAALRSYAVMQAAAVNAGLSSQIPLGNTAWQYAPVIKPSAIGISNAIAGLPISIDVVNPLDCIWANATVFDSAGYCLFYGWNQFYLAYGKGGYSLPPSYGNFTLHLAPRVPIKVPNAIAAMVTFRRPDGTSSGSKPLTVTDGRVFVSEDMVGSNAVLSVQVTIETKNGTEIGWKDWDMSTGSFLSREKLITPLSPNIEGLVVASGSGPVYVNVPTSNKVGTNVVIELNPTEKQMQIVIVATSEGKWFRGAYYRSANDTNWIYAHLVANDKWCWVEIPTIPGVVYHVIPDWNDGDLVEPDSNASPYDGGGKG